MTRADDTDRTCDPETVVKLRGDAPRVVRLSRKAVLGASAIALALVGGAMTYALRPVGSHDDVPHDRPSATIAVADGVASAPRDYAQIPRLGPPLPGDLGGPVLAASGRGAVAALPGPDGRLANPAEPVGPRARARRRAESERDAAISSRIFVAGGEGGEQSHPSSPDEPPMRAHAGDRATHKNANARSAVLQAGSIIPAALITGIRSDRPGLVTAQVTANVYDSLTGTRVLVPQGARLIGDTEANGGFGQRRVMLAWTRLVYPDGRSLALDGHFAADAAGYAGLEDEVDNHWGNVVKAALVSTLLGIGGELGADRGDDLVDALRQAGQGSVGRAGEQVVDRELGLRPTLTVRPGFPVRVLVARDIDLGELE